ncbi:DUF1146 domain-containing protein [Limosilactobacillus caecicola]|uniref:DUF1146 domain-containing protein n=1 Tax=Limosilactobacillus caecicola TaxID=2941332 RepID=UPI0020410586|nr:DUF1146 domain-containing protein [Limosilactobacillus caecicola]
MQYNGTQSVFVLICQLMFIFITFRALQSFHIDTFFRHPPRGLPVMIVLLSIAIGWACGTFFAEFFVVLRGMMNMVR